MAQSAENMARDACMWVNAHPSDFKRLMSVFHRQVDAGFPCTRRGDVYKAALDMGMDVSVVDQLRHDHNLYAPLTRYMVMLRPRLARTINFRKSKLDQIDLVSIWHQEVDPSTVFLASSRMEAERMVELNDAAAA